MATVLVINSTVSGAASVSRQLVDRAVADLRSKDPSLRVLERDLNDHPIPHLNAVTAVALRGQPPENSEQRDALQLSDQLIGELNDADVIIIGAPMYNFGIPSTLKSWFDYVLRAGLTFRYTAEGPEGLVKGKRAIVFESRGGLYSEGPAQAMDSQEPHLRTMLGFIGITDVNFIRIERLAFGPDISSKAIEDAKAEIRALAGKVFAKAA